MDAIRSKIDTLIIAGASLVAGMENIGAEFFTWLSAIYPHARRVAAICTSAFVLAKAGLVDNKNVVTHYEFCSLLKSAYPRVNIDFNPFFIKDGKDYTFGGVSSCINLSLALIEEDFGRKVALRVDRKLVLDLKRPGNPAPSSTFLDNFLGRQIEL